MKPQKIQLNAKEHTFLMCKNTPVYDITGNSIINECLLPGIMQRYPDHATFNAWMKYRYSSGTNTIARKLKSITFGQGARKRINAETHALNFCDCYWLKSGSEDIRFEDVSPYYTGFWDGMTDFHGQAAPTLYVSGALSKEWKSDVLRLFGSDGAKMLIIDAIIGNGDRHAGNFGWLRDSSTGEYLKMAPLYDFDHALDSTLASDRLLTDAVKSCAVDYPDIVTGIAEKAKLFNYPVFSNRAKTILDLMGK